MYGLRARIRKRKKASRQDHPITVLTISHQIGLIANIGQKHNRLRDDARYRLTTAACIDGSLGGGFSLGGVINDGEERSEGIHWCVCMWVERCYESV